MAARHVEVALTEGAQAGLDTFLTTAVSKRSPNYAKIVGNGRRTPATMLKHYCAIFNVEQAPSNDVTQGMVTDDKQAIAEALAALIARFNAIEGNDEPVVDEPEVEFDAIVTCETFITEDVAWSVLGQGVARPGVTRRAEAATNSQLWRMNTTEVFSPMEIARLNDLANS